MRERRENHVFGFRAHQHDASSAIRDAIVEVGKATRLKCELRR